MQKFYLTELNVSSKNYFEKIFLELPGNEKISIKATLTFYRYRQFYNTKHGARLPLKLKDQGQATGTVKELVNPSRRSQKERKDEIRRTGGHHYRGGKRDWKGGSLNVF
jgi:hypothetical protein